VRGEDEREETMNDDDKQTDLPVTAMTLRDHFAACAIQPLVAKMCATGIGSMASVKTAAGAAYEIADAMLAERAKAGAE
jgi:hypothetical protein